VPTGRDKGGKRREEPGEVAKGGTNTATPKKERPKESQSGPLSDVARSNWNQEKKELKWLNDMVQCEERGKTKMEDHLAAKRECTSRDNRRLGGKLKQSQSKKRASIRGRKKEGRTWRNV